MNINQNNTFGNNNVNVGIQQRHVQGSMEEQLKNMIKKSDPVKVTAAMGDGEAVIFAEEIRSFLAAEGYSVESGINQAIWMPALRGQSISPDLVDGHRLINIGHQ